MSGEYGKARQIAGSRVTNASAVIASLLTKHRRFSCQARRSQKLSDFSQAFVPTFILRSRQNQRQAQT